MGRCALRRLLGQGGAVARGAPPGGPLVSCSLEPLRAHSLGDFRQLEWQVESCDATLLGVYFSDEAFHAAASEFKGQLDANVWRDPRTGERTYTLWRYPADHKKEAA